MGQSTDAYLFYGIEAGEEMMNEEVAEILGIKEDPEDWEWLNHAMPEGLRLDSHCSCECQIPLICIDSTFMSAWRGSATRFEKLPDLDPGLVAELNELSEKLGWEKPSWMIVSMWC